MSFWTDERIAVLRQLYAEGLSSMQIARSMGAPSRSTVIGKIWRLELTRSTQPPRSSKVNGSAQHLRATPKRKQAEAPPRPPALDEPEPLTLADGTAVTLLNCGHTHCRYPKWGDFEQPTEFRICGQQKAHDSSYCEFHRKLTRGQGTHSERAVTKRPKFREPEAA